MNNKENKFLSQSQNGEDEFVWRYFNKSSSGTIIEVGAFDGLHLSNSLTLERIGWKAVCIEPIPGMFKKLVEHRPHAININAAIVSNENEVQVEFKVEQLGLLSGIQIDEDEVKKRYKKRKIPFKGFEKIKVKATTLNRLLKELKINEFDVLSIDVEGTEIEVLQGINLKKHRPSLIIVEANNHESELRIRKLLKRDNFNFLSKLGHNLIFSTSKKPISSIALDSPSFVHEHPLGRKFSRQNIKLRPTSLILFNKLLEALQSTHIIEIGSRDGLDALKLKSQHLTSEVICFEAHPENFERTLSNIALSSLNIQSHNVALSNINTKLKFYSYGSPGLSSLELRNDLEPQDTIQIEAKRLDQYIKTNNLECTSYAFWIDVEGHSLKVLQGSSGLLDKTNLIYTEIESEPVYQNQSSNRSSVTAFLKEHGFIELQFTPHGPVNGMVKVGDSVFIKKKLIKPKLLLVILNHLMRSLGVGFKISLFEFTIKNIPFLVEYWRTFKGIRLR